MDSIFASKNKIFYNQLANEYYLRVLNLATIAKQNYSYYTNEGSNNLFYTLNKNLFNFIGDLSKNRLLSNFKFNEIPNFLDQYSNPPYYFEASGNGNLDDPNGSVKVNTNMTISDDYNDEDVSINQLLVYGDIEYEQNFFTIKNIIERPEYNDASTNIILYFYAQNTNNRDSSFDNIFDMCANPIDTSNAFTNVNALASDSSYNIRNLVTDFSEICIYDYGNIMFALDGSFCNSIYVDESSLNYVLIPPLKQLTEIQNNLYNDGIFFNNNSIVNISNTMIDFFNVDTSSSIPIIDSDNTILDTTYYPTSKPYYNLVSGEIYDLKFIQCASSNDLTTANLSTIERDISNNTSKNILILCPVIEENYIITSNENIGALEDSSFNYSVYRYLPLIAYFNTLANDSNISLNLNTIVSTNQTDTINKLLLSFETGTLQHSGQSVNTDNSNIIMNGNFNNSRVFLTKYDNINMQLNNLENLSDFSVNFITCKSLNINNSLLPNIYNIIYLHNLNLVNIEDINIDFFPEDRISNYNTLQNSLYSYILTLLYSTSEKFGSNLINVINQQHQNNDSYSIFNFYKDLLPDVNNIHAKDNSSNLLINNILNKKIKLTSNAITKFLNTNFSFYEININTDLSFNSPDISSSELSNIKIWNYKIFIILLLTSTDNHFQDLYHTIKNTNFGITTIDMFKDKTPDENSLIYNNQNSNNNLTNLEKKSRYSLLKRWKETYKSPFQYLTINTGD